MKVIMKKISLLFGIILLTVSLQAQFVVDGSDITIQAGAEVFIDGDFINQSTGLTDNQGTIILTGDWLNNGTTNAISLNIGAVKLAGDSQLIGGTASTTFNQLIVATVGEKMIDRLTIIGSMGSLELENGVLALDGNTLEVQNSSSTAISRIAGVVASESSPVEGVLRWNVKNGSGVYQFPMGTMSGLYIPVELNITSSGLGMSGNGFISVSTYPTNDSNQLLPSGISNMNFNGTDVSLTTVDRFWDVVAGGYMIRPTSDISLTYDKANDFKTKNSIIEDSLVFLSWNLNWVENASTVNKTDSSVTLNGVSTYRNYTLHSRNTNATGINEFNANFSFVNSLYPNPSNGYSQLEIESKKNVEMSFQLYNNTGQLVFSKEQHLYSGVNTIKFDLNHLPNGIYYVILNSESLSDYSKLILTKD